MFFCLFWIFCYMIVSTSASCRLSGGLYKSVSTSVISVWKCVTKSTCFSFSRVYKTAKFLSGGLIRMFKEWDRKFIYCSEFTLVSMLKIYYNLRSNTWTSFQYTAVYTPDVTFIVCMCWIFYHVSKSHKHISVYLLLPSCCFIIIFSLIWTFVTFCMWFCHVIRATMHS